ncbi:MAG: hypothetical protein LBP72_01300 [Dysgonamonadaceae bacterium]|jgi:hypothetical protein|nr:hypothetical protein [Dysgonamonadaceae bacterium]
MKLEVVKHAGKVAGYNFVPENPAEESALKALFDNEKFPGRESCGKILQFIHADYALHDIKTLTKLGEVTTAEVVDEPEEYLICSECGSTNVQVKIWVYPNENNRYAGDVEDDAWCDDCNKHISLDLQPRPVSGNEHPKLLEKLQKEGYDTLEVQSDPLSLCRLLGTMDRIAQQLITSIYITDFTIHDRKAILESKAGRAFIWQVRNSGTWLYFTDEADWKLRLSKWIEFYQNASTENLYYHFDGKEFYPVFKKQILEMIHK